MLCLVMRFYPTFPPPGLLSTFVGRAPGNSPASARRSVWDASARKQEKSAILAPRDEESRQPGSSFSCPALKLKL